MIQLAYTSLACQPMQKQALLKLLQQARLFNQLNNITGILLYKDQSFFQVIEGEEKVIDKLMLSIFDDPRHHNINILFRRIAEHRHFNMWSMGYIDIERSEYDLKNWGSESFLFPLQNMNGNLTELVSIATAKQLVMSFASARESSNYL